MARASVRRIDRVQRLVVFDAAARLGGFSAAARDLGMTQPAVTRQIRALERALGVELFARTSNRSELTDVGRRVHAHVAAGLDRFDAAVAELATSSGTFVLAAHPGVAQLWLVPRLDEITAAVHPLDLRLWLFDRDDEIAAGGFDAAIRVGTGDFAGQDAELLFPERVAPICSPAFAAEHGLHAGSTAADVYRVPFVHMDDGGRPWMTWADWLSEFGIELRRSPGRVLFHNYPMVLQQALVGRGVALGWRVLVDDLVAGDALEIVGPEVGSERAYYVTWPTGPPSPGVHALVTWLVEQVNRPA